MNPQTILRPKLLFSLVLCLLILGTAQRAEAGPILPGSGYGEVQAAFSALVNHGAIVAPGATHILAPAAPGSQFWDILITITEIDGGAGKADSIVVALGSRHKVGVHDGENPILFITLTGLAKPEVAFPPGVNVINATSTIDHPPIAGHTDQFSIKLTFTVAMDGLNITDFKVEVSGRHCSPQCPDLPPINKQLKDIPEPNALMLFGSGLVGLLGYARRRRKLRLTH
jgi:hypothetical protein